MKDIHKYIPIFLLFSLIAVRVSAQESTLQDKRDRKKEVRNLLKECVLQYNSEEFSLVQAISDSILSLESNNSDAFYYKGLSFLKTQDTANALVTLRQGIVEAPLASRLKILLSRILLSQNKSSEAITTIDQVLSIKPNLSEALYLKGLAYLNLSDSTQALIFFKQSLEHQILKE